MQTELETSKRATGANSVKDSSAERGISGSESGIMSAGQEFAVSAVSAGLAHLIHHPLYTLKSQMMFYGPKFRPKIFFEQALHQKHNFLYRGGSEVLKHSFLACRCA
jgi:hypothetical protein